jgi:nitrogen fixation/metabolism regulation signal transduction histidine kinase
MSLKWRYIIYIGCLHLLLAGLAYLLLREQLAWFIGVEVLVLISLVLAYGLYSGFTRPLRLLGSGIDAIKDQDFAIQLRPTGSKEMDKLVKVYNQMMENIRKERAQVQEQHYFLDRLIQASPAGIILLDYDDHITEINPKGKSILDMQQAPMGQTLLETGHPLLKQLSDWEAGQSGVLSAGKGQGRFRCEVSHFIHRGFHRKFIMLQDLSNEMLSAEKRAYGKVIRMMAHEVNNSIGAINSILQSTIEAYPDLPDDDLAEDIKASLEVARQRNDRLNQFMRNFAKVVRLPNAERQRLDLNKLMYNIQQLMLPQAEQQQTRLSLDVPANPTYFQADEQQLEQALVNMIKNALESLEQGGEVILQLQPSPLQLIVLDNGPGLSPEFKGSWDTPFFSTKAGGQGIGMTLIREITRQHHGHVELETMEDGWTACRLVFRL